MNKVKKALIVCLCFVLMCLSATALTAHGAREIALTIEYMYNAQPVAGAEFDIFRIADFDGENRLSPVEPFKKYPVDFSKTDINSLNGLAFTLAAYAAADDITPYDRGKTDENGRVIFPNNATGLSKGLYLIVGHSVTDGENTYFTEPFLAFLPAKAENGSDGYSVIARPKCTEKVPGSSGDEYRKLKVLKIWDDNNSSQRPESITVELIGDGKVKDTVILSSKNNWRHTWERLSSESEWYIVERSVPSGYIVQTALEGITYTVINKAENPPPVTEPPEETTRPSGGTTTTVPTTEEKPEKPDLPQTGMLKWPIPYIAMAGIILIMIGWVKNRKSEIKNEE